MRTYTHDTFTRVQKRTARRLYNEGRTIYALPCNMHPDNVWQAPAPLPPADDPTDFGKVTNVFEYYNCDAERGKYTAYYIKELDFHTFVNRFSYYDFAFTTIDGKRGTLYKMDKALTDDDRTFLAQYDNVRIMSTISQYAPEQRRAALFITNR